MPETNFKLHPFYSLQVFCTCEFEALHQWLEAEEPVAFLQHPHRHVFHVTAWAGVSHENRDIEFITMKRQVAEFCNSNWKGKNIGSMSCEMIGVAILNKFPHIHCVQVSEDGENGAVVQRR